MSIEAVDGQEVDTWVPLSWTALYQRMQLYTSVCHATQPLPLPPSLYAGAFYSFFLLTMKAFH